MLSFERLQMSPEGNITGRKRRQLFVTKSRLLAGRVHEYFMNLSRSVSTRDRSLNYHRDETAQDDGSKEDIFYADDEDEGDYRSDLPKKFSELEDKHFPLFLTFDKVSTFLASVSSRQYFL
jgi:hypothetical protein